MVYAEIAIQRAALWAREKARRLGLGVVVLKDGKIVEEKPSTTRNLCFGSQRLKVRSYDSRDTPLVSLISDF